MNKSAAVITGTGANSIIRAAKTLPLNHYSQRPLHVKICVRTGAPLHIIYSESGGFKQGGKRAIMLKIASEVVRSRPCSGTLVEVRLPWVDHSSVSLPDVGRYHNRGHPPHGNHVPQNQHFMGYLMSVTHAG